MPGRDEVPAQVDPDHQVPLLLGHAEDHAVAHHAGVVDDGVEPSERRDRRSDQALTDRPLADVAGDHDGVAAQRLDLLGDRSGRGRVDVVEDHACAGTRQAQRLRLAQAVTGAGDDDDGAIHRDSSYQYPGPLSMPPSATNSLPVE